MIWIESPTNPLLKLADINAIATMTKKFNNDIIVVVDNTFMSPYFQVCVLEVFQPTITVTWKNKDRCL